MQSKWLSGVIVAAAALWPASASACDFYLAYGPMGLQTGQFALGGAILFEPGEDDADGFIIPSADLGIRIGERFVVHPALGYCTGGDDFSEIIIGGGAGVNLISNDQWSLGVQSHLARTSFEDGSEMAIPVMASATFDVSETARLYAGFGLRFFRLSIDALDESETESDPAASAGITLPLGSLQVSGGIVLVNTDDDTDFSFGGGVQFPLGG